MSINIFLRVWMCGLNSVCMWGIFVVCMRAFFGICTYGRGYGCCVMTGAYYV